MDVKKIQPFVDATREVFQTMLQCALECGKPRLPELSDRNGDMSAVIGLSGTVRGSVSISLPLLTARRITRKMLCSDDNVADADVVDAIGELANMIAGSAKAKLEGHELSVSLPTVVKGDHYWLEYPKDTVTLVIPFDSVMGAFKVHVTFSRNGK